LHSLDLEVSEETDMMDLIDAVGKAKGDLECLKKVIRLVSEKTRKSEEDRETFGDFDGVVTVLTAVRSQEDDSSKAEAMKELCRAMPGICAKSTINRGLIRDEGGVDDLVDFLEVSLKEKNEEQCLAACVALKAACLSNDGNKQAAARLYLEDKLKEEEELKKAQEEAGETTSTDCQEETGGADDERVPLFKAERRKSTVDLLIEMLEAFGPVGEHLEIQSAGFWALRTLCCDDDNRRVASEGGAELVRIGDPAAVENRRKLSDEERFPRLRKLVNAAMSFEPEPPKDLLEATLLLMKESCNGEEQINCLVKEDGMLTKVRKFLTAYAQLPEAESDTVVRCCVFLLRQFAFSDDLKEMIGFETDLASVVIMVVRQRMKSVAIVEQAFGLFSNIVLRKLHIAEKLYAEPNRLALVAQVVLSQYKDHVGVVKTVLQTLRNLSKVEGCVEEMRDNEIFEQMRQLVRERRGDAKWKDPVEISLRFLAEYREDEGVRNATKYNEYY